MVDLEVLYRKLDGASFKQREQLADEVVRDNPPEAIVPIVRGLGHPHESVRLGVIEILRRATSREALRKLVEHAQAHEGTERVFTVRAIASLAQPGDDFLAPYVKKWLTSGDEFLVPHAQKIADLIAAPKIRPPESSAPVAKTEAAPTADSLDKLVVALFTATKATERIAIVEQIEKRGPQALAAAAKIVLAKGNADLVAYIARAIIRGASLLAAPERLVPLLEQARKRVGATPITNAAIDDALLAIGGLTRSADLLARIGEMDKPQVDAIIARLCESDAASLALHVPVLLDALAKKPALWTSLGPALVYAAPHVRESTRAELRQQTNVIVDELRRGKQHPPVTLVSLAWVLARIAERGEPLPKQLRLALDRVAANEASSALVALCARLGTEEAAHVVLGMLRDPLPEARAAARDAVNAWDSPWVRIENDAVVPTYVDDKGQPLERRGDKLVVAATGEEYVLDGKGRPTRRDDTEWGGCLCCSPPRLLVRRRGEGLRCPSTWESHLRDGGRTIFEREHALGRCKRCDSPRPRVRDGGRAICLDCGAGISADEALLPPPGHEPVPSERGGKRSSDDDMPKPPTKAELENVAPHIRAAIRANVFLHSRDAEGRGNGSGIIIARDGNHVAILTNRHVVETDDRKMRTIDALTVTGEIVRASCVWRAQRGIDLAIVEARVQKIEDVEVMPIGSGVGLVGAEVFAIGNPLGLAWTYSRGTLSAIRHWTTQEGQSVRILQTDANIAPGSSGGGLFHGDGHLLGVMSFIVQGYAGGSAHFALSVDAIREAFARENVRWHGATLADLPK